MRRAFLFAAFLPSLGGDPQHIPTSLPETLQFLHLIETDQTDDWRMLLI